MANLQSTNKNLITKAIIHENRLRLHSDASLNDTPGIRYFLEWVRSILPLDKYEIFVSLMKYPIATTGLIDSIYNELSKVFDSKDPRIEYFFHNDEVLDDFKTYMYNLLYPLWDRSKDIMKKRINSIIVIDLPESQQTEYPEPYWIEVTINAVFDFEINVNGDFIWLAYLGNDNVLYYVDSEYYRTYDNKDSNWGSVIREAKHNLGFAPAKFFWSDSLQESKALKSSPISGQLAELDWLLYWMISKKHLDNYAAYPIYSAYEQECDYEEETTGKYCDRGFLKQPNGYYSTTVYSVEKCPVCSGKRFGGVGSFVEVPVPDSETPDMSNPVQLTTVDKNSLDYNTNELYRLQREIFRKITGDTGEMQKEQAVNEKQITASFEAKLQVINNLKKNFEALHKFIADTVGKLRYKDNYKGSDINWGTEFYLYTANELYAIYSNAKKAGVSKIVLDNLLRQMYETMYKNNPNNLERALIAFDLEPYIHLTDEEMIKLFEQGLVSRTEVRVKTNFSSYLSRFEYENNGLVIFGSKLKYETKIMKISKILYDYGREE